MSKTKVKAVTIDYIDMDTEKDIVGYYHVFFGTERELMLHINCTEKGLSEEYNCEVSASICEYRPEDIAYDIVTRRHFHHSHLNPGYNEHEVASDLFHMYYTWVDSDFCKTVLPHVIRLMAEKAAAM